MQVSEVSHGSSALHRASSAPGTVQVPAPVAATVSRQYSGATQSAPTWQTAPAMPWG